MALIPNINGTVNDIISQGGVYLSIPLTCHACGVRVRYVGEHRTNGSWFCPAIGCSFNAPFSLLRLTYERRAHRVQSSDEVFTDSSEQPSDDRKPVNVAHTNGE
jgi:hypothetical protein